MNCLVPVSTYLLPSRRARVRIAGGVRAGLGLGQAEGARASRRAPSASGTALLLVGAEFEQRHAADRVLHAHDGRAGAVAGGDLLQRQRIGDMVGGGAVIGLGHQHAEQPELAHLAQRLGREARSAVPFGGERLQPLVGEIPRHVADHRLLLRQDHGREATTESGCRRNRRRAGEARPVNAFPSACDPPVECRREEIGHERRYKFDSRWIGKLRITYR